jgi:hypothetical protein
MERSQGPVATLFISGEPVAPFTRPVGVPCHVTVPHFVFDVCRVSPIYLDLFVWHHHRLSRGSGAGTSGAAAKVAIVCNRETIAPTNAPTIARIVGLRARIGALVGAIVGAIVSRLQTIATFAAAPLVPAPLPRLKYRSMASHLV